MAHPGKSAGVREMLLDIGHEGLEQARPGVKEK